MALPAPAQPQPPRQAKGPPRHADAGGYAMTVPITRADLEVAVSKLATKEELAEAVSKLATKEELAEAVSKLATKADLALLQKDVDFLKEKMEDLQEEMRKAHKNFVTREELEASQAKLGERLQREMRMQTLYMLGGIGTLVTLLQLFG